MTTPAVAETPDPRPSQARPPNAAMFGMKVAQFHWPPPPTPASSSKVAASALRRGGLGSSLGFSGEIDVSDSVAATDMRNRAELWDIRAEIEREKMKMVAPYPFFGCPMRFSDDFTALQIGQDGRFSFSETSMEVADPESSPSHSRPQVGGVIRRVVTYEGVFTGTPHIQRSPDEDAPQTKAFSSSTKTLSSSMGASKLKDKVNVEEPVQLQSDPEMASIEATALVKHEIVEAGGRTRLVLVERGNFGFDFSVSPFFQPAYALVKVQKTVVGGPPPKRWRLPYIGTGDPIGSTMQRSSSVASGLALQRTRRKCAVEISPFRSAAHGSLVSPQSITARRKHHFRGVPGQMQLSQSASNWRVC